MSDAAKPISRSRPVVLCILDGWGERAERDNNAIALASTPNWDRMAASWPRSTLDTSGSDVGLPDGQMGNSEVGHMNIGAGRIVWQDLPRITKAIEDGSLKASPEIAKFVNQLKATGGCCHLLGLMSEGGVHAHQDHIVALAAIISAAGIEVKVHAFTDGRDTAPRGAIDSIQPVLAALQKMPGVSIVTVSGRYYAMDRDNRWDRVQLCYDALVAGKGDAFADVPAMLNAGYDKGVSDEFMLPSVIGGYEGMEDGDGLLMANYRADRARELLTALADPEFNAFQRCRTVAFAARLGMVAYSDQLNKLYDIVFPPTYLTETLGEIVSSAGLRQLRLAETEKYAHVTFFFNGRRETPFVGEERILVPSPKVATYDLQPEMSAGEVTDHLVNAITGKGEGGAEDRPDLVIVNYANGDMVGHSGVLAAAVEAAETLDACLERIEAALIEAGGAMLVTADHGNCEMMVDPVTGGPHTSHTMNPVPILLVNHPDRSATIHAGRLADIAPTLLAMMGLPQPDKMTGRSVIDG